MKKKKMLFGIFIVIIVITAYGLLTPSEFEKELKYYEDKGYPTQAETIEEYKAGKPNIIFYEVETSSEELRIKVEDSITPDGYISIVSYDRDAKTLWILGEHTTSGIGDIKFYIYFFKAQ